MSLISVFSELRVVRREGAELVGTGHGVIEVQRGPFGPILVARRDGRESIVPIDTARVLFGDAAVGAVIEVSTGDNTE